MGEILKIATGARPRVWVEQSGVQFAGKRTVSTVFLSTLRLCDVGRMGSARNAEVVVSEPAAKRRNRSKQERRQIVEETLQPGASVAVIARQHGVNANQVFPLAKALSRGAPRCRGSAATVAGTRCGSSASGAASR